MNAKVSVVMAQTTMGQLMTLVLNKVGLLLFAYLNGVLIAWLVQKRTDIKSNKKGAPSGRAFITQKP